MAKLIQWNLSRLHVKSRVMTGPLPELYVRDLTRMVEELQGVYLSGIQVGDARRFAIPNPRFKGFPILYNPEIVGQDDLVKSEGEGCLSFPGMWCLVPRYRYVTVRFRDGQWKEQTMVFGSDELESEESLLAKAVQHEIFHMDGIVVHERVSDPGKRIKFEAQILKHSIVQNRTTGIPKLVEGPPELDPCSLPVITDNTSTPNETSSGTNNSTEDNTADTIASGLVDTEQVVCSAGITTGLVEDGVSTPDTSDVSPSSNDTVSS